MDQGKTYRYTNEDERILKENLKRFREKLQCLGDLKEIHLSEAEEHNFREERLKLAEADKFLAKQFRDVIKDWPDEEEREEHGTHAYSNKGFRDDCPGCQYQRLGLMLEDLKKVEEIIDNAIRLRFEFLGKVWPETKEDEEEFGQIHKKLQETKVASDND